MWKRKLLPLTLAPIFYLVFILVGEIIGDTAHCRYDDIPNQYFCQQTWALPILYLKDMIFIMGIIPIIILSMLWVLIRLKRKV